jgi:hypothetical protein
MLILHNWDGFAAAAELSTTDEEDSAEDGPVKVPAEEGPDRASAEERASPDNERFSTDEELETESSTLEADEPSSPQPTKKQQASKEAVNAQPIFERFLFICILPFFRNYRKFNQNFFFSKERSTLNPLHLDFFHPNRLQKSSHLSEKLVHNL